MPAPLIPCFLCVCYSTAVLSNFPLSLPFPHACSFVASLVCPRHTPSSRVERRGLLMLSVSRPCSTHQEGVWRGLFQVCAGVFPTAICATTCRGGAPVVGDPVILPVLVFPLTDTPMLFPPGHCFNILLETQVIHHSCCCSRRAGWIFDCTYPCIRR